MTEISGKRSFGLVVAARFFVLPLVWFHPLPAILVATGQPVLEGPAGL